MLYIKNGQTPKFEFKTAVKRPIPIRVVQLNEAFIIETMEGKLKGLPGDYLMVGIKGEMYPCRKEIFEESYIMIDELGKEKK
jgi:hypothetical protein